MRRRRPEDRGPTRRTTRAAALGAEVVRVCAGRKVVAELAVGGGGERREVGALAVGGDDVGERLDLVPLVDEADHVPVGRRALAALLDQHRAIARVDAAQPAPKKSVHGGTGASSSMKLSPCSARMSAAARSEKPRFHGKKRDPRVNVAGVSWSASRQLSAFGFAGSHLNP